MNQFSRTFALSATALAASLLVAACGGGDAEPPPPASSTSTPTVVDTTAPTLAISDSVSGTTATGDVTFTFSFSEDVGTSFTADDVVVTEGTKGVFLRTGTTQATLVVTPTANTTGTLQVSVGAGVASDAAGNTNPVAVTATRAFDTLAPVIRTTLVSFQEATPPTLIGFGNANGTVVTDPTDATNKVARVVKSANAELWAGVTVAVCPSDSISVVPFSATNQQLSVRVWSPDAGIPVRLKLEDAADGSKTVETEATVTTAAGWQTLTFNFASPVANTSALNLATTYNRASIFFNFGTTGAAVGADKIYYFDDLSFVGTSYTAACPTVGGGGGGTPTAPAITFDEATPPSSTGFGGASVLSIVNDPTNAANKVASITKDASAELWAGTTIWTGAAESIPVVNFTAGNTTITARVYSPLANIPVRMKLEDAADNTKTVETEATVTAAAGWQTLSFNFANPAAGTAPFNLAQRYNKLSVFFNFGKTGGESGGARTYLIDDIVMPAAAAGGGGGGTGGSGATGNCTTANCITFSGTAITFSPFENGGGGTVELADDPKDASNRAVRFVKKTGDPEYFGTVINGVGPVTLAAGAQTVTMRVLSPAPGTNMLLKLEGAGGAATEVDVATTKTDEWETLSFAMPGTGTFSTVVVFPNGRSRVSTDKTIYIDELTFPGAASGGGGGGTGGFAGGIFASDYTGDLGANTARSTLGGTVGFFLDQRLFDTKIFQDGGVAGSAQDPGGVHNFYYGIGKAQTPVFTDAFFGGFVNAPGNGSADASAYAKIRLKFWGDAESWEKSNFTAQVDVILQGPTNAACTNPSGRPELVRAVTAQKIGAGSEYVINKTDFTLAQSCGGAYTVNSVWAAIGSVVVRLSGTNLQYVNTVPSTPPSYPTFINIGPISFIN
jgi:hypothetical protein